MKKIIKTLLAGVMAITSLFAFNACGNDTIYVNTNAYFAPFEYYQGTEIVGVDVDIMNKVGERLGKKVKFVNTDFDVIIDNVASGKQYDCGAAGITITQARAQRVDFSNPYYTSVQYVIYDATSIVSFPERTATDGTACVFWSDLMNMDLGVQRDTTGNIYADIEINGDGPDYPGELAGTTGELKPFDNAEVAVAALGIQVDAVIVDELPAKYITSKNSQYVCKALYYDADTATEEQYAIAVTKGNKELLDAINAVLAELGEEGINALVKQHLGLTD